MSIYWKRRRRLLTFRRTILRVTRNEHLVMVVLSIATGLMAGLGAAAVRYLIHAVQQAGYGSVDSLVKAAGALPFWKVLLIPAIGGALVRYSACGRRGPAHDITGPASALRPGRGSGSPPGRSPRQKEETSWS